VEVENIIFVSHHHPVFRSIRRTSHHLVDYSLYTHQSHRYSPINEYIPSQLHFYFGYQIVQIEKDYCTSINTVRPLSQSHNFNFNFNFNLDIHHIHSNTTQHVLLHLPTILSLVNKHPQIDLHSLNRKHHL
jgi:hypothetical protein